jgi:Cu+-exporting ATPase
MSIMVGTGHGAQNGVLIKKAEALETLEKVNTIVVDKTGTLTDGKPTVQKVVAFDGHTEEEVLALAASLERHSEHPVASAILAEADERGLTLRDVADFKSVTGLGLFGNVDGRDVALGRMGPSNELKPNPSYSDHESAETNTWVFVQADGLGIGNIIVSDGIKPSAKRAIDQLHGENIEVVMMTGDNRATAEAVANQLGIDQLFAEVMPADKAEKVKELQSQGRIVAMAGDGVNDAPALAQADVGIAFASGTDVAIESADITLLRPDLDGILKARNLSRATMGNIRQNLFFAFIYNLIGVPIAAGVLFPIFGILLSPMIASAAMTFSSVSVILNALRLRNRSL